MAKTTDLAPLTSGVAPTKQAPREPERAHVVGGMGEPMTALVRLPVHPGAPLQRALIVDRTMHGVDVHLECASDGTLLVRISGRAS